MLDVLHIAKAKCHNTFKHGDVIFGVHLQGNLLAPQDVVHAILNQCSVSPVQVATHFVIQLCGQDVVDIRLLTFPTFKIHAAIRFQG
ncbi:hypothetical protein D3C75_781280 [compost metagenome]